MLTNKVTFKDFQEHCKMVAQSTTVVNNEPIANRNARITKAKSNYKYFFEYYFPHYATAEVADFQIDAANALKGDKTFKGILEWFRGAAKSVHADIGFALWLKINGELPGMLLVGENETKANRLLADVQAELQHNQRFINDFGAQWSYGNWADGEFVTKDGTAFFAIGLGQSPRGTRFGNKRPGYIVVDDVDSKKLSKNPRLVGEAVDWIIKDLMGCFDIGFERFIFVNNRISKTSILARLVDELVIKRKKEDRAYYSKINAVDKHGNPTWPQKYTREYWQKKRAKMPMRAWETEYMNNPIEEGKIFKYSWIQWCEILPLNKYDAIVVYCDPSFKSNATSDFKAIKVWGKAGTQLHLIKAFVRRCSIGIMVKWFYDFNETLPSDVICDYFMEANFIQDSLLDEFTLEGDLRGYQLPIRGDKRDKPDKFGRIEAMSPLYERGFVWYNIKEKDNPDMKEGTDQLLAIENGSNTPDDSPDADEGAIYYLQRRGRMRNFNPIIGSEPKSIY